MLFCHFFLLALYHDSGRPIVVMTVCVYISVVLICQVYVGGSNRFVNMDCNFNTGCHFVLHIFM